MEKINIGVFSEWGESVGSGHINRVKKLIDFFTKFYTFDIEFFNNLDSKTNWLNKERFIDFIAPFSHIIIDSYLADFSLIKLADSYKKSLIFDDLFLDYSSLENSIIVNGNLGSKSSLKNHFYGAEFNLANREIFLNKRIESNKKITDIFLFLGGGDEHNLTQSILDKLYNSSLHFHIVLGEFNNKTINTKLRHTLYKNLDSISLSNVMKKCDIAITSGGQILYELALNQLPIFAIILAPNQAFQVQQFVDSGGAKIATLDNIESIIASLDSSYIFNMSQNLAKINIGNDINKLLTFI